MAWPSRSRHVPSCAELHALLCALCSQQRLSLREVALNSCQAVPQSADGGVLLFHAGFDAHFHLLQADHVALLLGLDLPQTALFTMLLTGSLLGISNEA